MKLFLAILLAVQPTFALTTNNKVMAFNRSEGAYLYENYAIQQSFDKNLNGVTTLGGTPSIVTGSSKLIGVGSLNWATAANTDIMTINSKAMPIGMNGLNCQSKFTYATPSGGPVSTQEFTVQAKNSSGTAISALTNLPATFDIANTQASRTVILYYPCPYNSATPANSYVQLEFKHTASNTTSLIIDELFHTYATDIGSGVPNNVFSAKVSAAGVVSDESGGDWINGNCSIASTSNYTCNFSSGNFNITPNCTATPSKSGTTGELGRFTLQSSSSITFYTFVVGVGNSASDWNLTCTKAGADFIQPAITPNQWNFDWTTCPSISGTWVTNAAYVCKWMRKGGDAYFDISVNTSGAPTAAILDINLPIIIDTTRMAQALGGSTVMPNGTGSATDTGVFVGDVTPYYLSSTAIRVYSKSASGTYVSQALVNATTPFAFGAGDNVSVKFSVPVLGWTENQNAPQLIGSVTQDGGGADKYVRATGNVNCTSGTCSLGSSTNDVTINWLSTGSYSVAFAKPFLTIPYCECSAVNIGASAANCLSNSVPTVSGWTIITTNTGGGLFNTAPSIKCTGTR